MPKKHYFWTKTLHCRLIGIPCDHVPEENLASDYDFKPPCIQCEHWEDVRLKRHYEELQKHEIKGDGI